jgi:chromosome segregation ATPase
MTLSHEEKIKLNNFDAQYSSILTNISVESKKLTEILKDREILVENTNLLKEEISKEKELLSILKLEQEKIVNELYNKEQSLNQREAALVLKAQEFLAYKDGEMRVLAEEKCDLEKEIISLKAVIDGLEKERIATLGDLNRSKYTLADVIKEIDAVKERRFEITKEVDDMALRTDEARKVLNAQIAESEAQLEDINMKIADEGRKIETPRLALEAERVQFESEKIQFKTVVNRFRKHFKQLYPGQDIPF